MIKKTPSLKSFGGESLNSKNIMDRSGGDTAKRSSGMNLGKIP
jgi:hypothetical protein